MRLTKQKIFPSRTRRSWADSLVYERHSINNYSPSIFYAYLLFVFSSSFLSLTQMLQFQNHNFRIAFSWILQTSLMNGSFFQTVPLVLLYSLLGISFSVHPPFSLWLVVQIPPSTCKSESIYKFHVPCAQGEQRITDSYGNQILEAVVGSFPILANNGLSFGFFLLKVKSRIKGIG